MWRRYKLKQKYGQVTLEIALADELGLHPKLKLHYHLTMGRSFVEAKDIALLKTLLEKNDDLFEVARQTVYSKQSFCSREGDEMGSKHF